MSLQFLQNALKTDNVKAFLMMIRNSEGTVASDGYNYLFGSSPANSIRFTEFSHHPNVHEAYKDTSSTAAGAYQILFGTWSAIQAKYNLPDFSPANQDIAAVELISEKNALQLIVDGKFEEALKLCSSIWASLPYNSYGQPTHALTSYLDWYTQNGGVIAKD